MYYSITNIWEIRDNDWAAGLNLFLDLFPINSLFSKTVGVQFKIRKGKMSAKKQNDKNLEKILNIRVSAELAEALEETKWSLRKSISEVVREAVELYLDNNLDGDVKLRVDEILHKEAK